MVKACLACLILGLVSCEARGPGRRRRSTVGAEPSVQEAEAERAAASEQRAGLRVPEAQRTAAVTPLRGQWLLKLT